MSVNTHFIIWIGKKYEEEPTADIVEKFAKTLDTYFQEITGHFFVGKELYRANDESIENGKSVCTELEEDELVIDDFFDKWEKFFPDTEPISYILLDAW